MIYNDQKSVFSTRSLAILGCIIEDGKIQKSIEESVATTIDENVLFELETDTSEVAIVATLKQAGHPVAFFSRMLQGPEI